MNEDTYWNGEKTPAHCVILKLEGDGGHLEYWAREFIGLERKAVCVDYYDTKFYLDNEDGEGWKKVTVGYGSPRWPHRSLYGVEVK